MERSFLVLGAVFGLTGVLPGAFGSHGMRWKLSAERVARFETGIRYQLWHALALFAVVFVGSLSFVHRGGGTSVELYLFEESGHWLAWTAGWLFVAGGTQTDFLFPSTDPDTLHGNEDPDSMDGGNHNDDLFGGVAATRTSKGARMPTTSRVAEGTTRSGVAKVVSTTTSASGGRARMSFTSVNRSLSDVR